MKKLLILVMLFAPLVVFGTGVSQIAQPKTAKPRIVISIKTAKTSVKAGSVVEVKVEEKNISDRDVPGADAFSPSTTFCRWKVRDNLGKQVPMTEYGLKANHLASPDGVPRISSGSSFSSPLGPGQTMTQNLALSKEYDLSNPGKYAIQAISSDGETDVKSNTITLTVTP